jgi:hypothetical protein
MCVGTARHCRDERVAHHNVSLKFSWSASSGVVSRWQMRVGLSTSVTRACQAQAVARPQPSRRAGFLHRHT